MPLPASLQEIVEYRGVEKLVAAKILTDDNESGNNHGYTTDAVFAIAGVAEISKSTEQSSEAHYYDNIPAVVINSIGSDEITISASAVPLDVLAEIQGQTYDSALGAYIEGEGAPSYYALGYITSDTAGHEHYVWRYKGMFSVGEQTNTTKDDGTDANGLELTYTGIATTHRFTKTGKGAKSMEVDVSKDLANVTNFFATVTTPDSLTAK